MKLKNIIALALCLVLALSMVACGGNADKPANDTTTAGKPDNTTTPAPVDQDTTTAAPVVDDTTPAQDTTTAPYEGGTTDPAAADTTPAETTPVAPLAPIDYDDLSDAEKAALKAVMPATLPDNSTYEIVSRTMCFDRGAEDYFVEGNSKGSVSFVDDLNGAVYGQAIKFAAKADSNDARGEIQVAPFEDVLTQNCKGVLFYVDFSNVIPTGEADKMCASVTINTNDIRAQGPEKATGSGIGYYYTGTEWVQTSNINACRMLIPDNFAGWIYIPASSFYDKNASAGVGEVFGDIFVVNMRCYTDGYVYSTDNYIIFDEITFVK
ncbi:MAG: hypothetical protein IJY27_01370 [Clostridia bacterium]|nr:hypothetical protein [Clostridia bacterium]